MFMVSDDQRLLIDRQESEQKRKLSIRYWSHTSGMCNRPVAACEHAATDRYFGDLFGTRCSLSNYLGAPTSFALGDTAYHVPPTPWPLVSPGCLSPEKV